jgi:hypothetical protein
MKRKYKRFDIKTYYRNESKAFWFGPLIIRAKVKQFDLVQTIFSQADCFRFVPKILGQSKAISFGLEIV